MWGLLVTPVPELPAGAGAPMVFFPGCAPQHTVCILITTFVLLTQSLALWLLLLALSFRNVS